MRCSARRRPAFGPAGPRLIGVLLTFTALLAAAGCVPQAPGPLPQATPSWSCTPVAGGTPYACYENQYQETAAQNELYAQAEAVYRKYNAENLRILRNGGVSEPTQTLLDTTTGTYLDEAMEEYRGFRKANKELLEGNLDIVWIRRAPNSVTAGSVATLEACKDVSDAVFRGAGGQTYQIGQDNAERLHFVDMDGVLKIASAEHQRVKAC